MSTWFTATLSRPSGTLSYTRTGGPHPPLLLIHGFTDSGELWTRAAQAWATHFDVLMPDLWAHGASATPAIASPAAASPAVSGISGTGYAFADFTADLAALHADLALPPLHVVGHSFGALLALHFAATYPERVTAVVAEDPPLGLIDLPDPAWAHLRAEWEATIRQRHALSFDELVALAQAAYPAWPPEEHQRWARSKHAVRLEAAQIFQRPAEPFLTTVSRITCPILLITGDPNLGSMVSPEAEQALRAVCHNGRAIRFANTGHQIRQDHLSEVVTLIDEFFKEN